MGRREGEAGEIAAAFADELLELLSAEGEEELAAALQEARILEVRRGDGVAYTHTSLHLPGCSCAHTAYPPWVEEEVWIREASVLEVVAGSEGHAVELGCVEAAGLEAWRAEYAERGITPEEVALACARLRVRSGRVDHWALDEACQAGFHPREVAARGVFRTRLQERLRSIPASAISDALVTLVARGEEITELGGDRSLAAAEVLEAARGAEGAVAPATHAGACEEVVLVTYGWQYDDVGAAHILRLWMDEIAAGGNVVVGVVCSCVLPGIAAATRYGFGVGIPASELPGGVVERAELATAASLLADGQHLDEAEVRATLQSAHEALRA